MSDSRKVLVDSVELENLVRAATQLASSAVALASAASSQIPERGIGAFIRIASESEPEGLKDREWNWRTKFDRIAEEGPAEVPDQLFEFGRYLLPCSDYSAHLRVADAFRAGFWARVALDTLTPYTCIAPAPRVPAHWIVLRAADRKCPVRFEDLTSYRNYVEGVWGSELIHEEFQNIAEVHIFCHAARIFLPECLVWRSRD